MTGGTAAGDKTATANYPKPCDYQRRGLEMFCLFLLHRIIVPWDLVEGICQCIMLGECSPAAVASHEESDEESGTGYSASVSTRNTFNTDTEFSDESDYDSGMAAYVIPLRVERPLIAGGGDDRPSLPCRERTRYPMWGRQWNGKNNWNAGKTSARQRGGE